MAAATTSRKCHGALRRLLCGAACLASAVPARRSPPRRCHVPPESHRVLVTREGSRTIIVGDVHGCLDELKSLLQACGFDASTDHVVLVGDLVNKGPHSAETVAYARESGFACVRGNHDDAALFAHEARSEAGARGSDSKYSELKYAWVDALGEADLAFLQELPHALRLAREEVLVVHAGVVPGVPLAEQRAEDMTTMRNLVRADGGGCGRLPAPLLASRGQKSGGQSRQSLLACGTSFLGTTPSGASRGTSTRRAWRSVHTQGPCACTASFSRPSREKRRRRCILAVATEGDSTSLRSEIKL